MNETNELLWRCSYAGGELESDGRVWVGKELVCARIHNKGRTCRASERGMATKLLLPLRPWSKFGIPWPNSSADHNNEYGEVACRSCVGYERAN